jgi:hypothetical protein
VSKRLRTVCESGLSLTVPVSGRKVWLEAAWRQIQVDFLYSALCLTIIMKNLFLFLVVLFLSASSVIPHGIGGHLYSANDDRKLSRDPQSSDSGKSFTQPVIEASERWWGASLSTGWTSREMHYGVDETGNYGAYTTEVAFRIHNLTFSVWSGFGTGNDYQEWDFTVAYRFDVGAVFFAPGYNFRYQPGIVDHEHSESVGENHEHHEAPGHGEHGQAHEHHEHSHTTPGHSHNT